LFGQLLLALEELVELLLVESLEVFRGAGHWSIWMTIFDDHDDMRTRLLDAIPDTASKCFNATAKPSLRPGGVL
jgi:hypothetical protein